MNELINRRIVALVVALSSASCAREVDLKGASDDKRRPEAVANQEFPASRRARTAVNVKPMFGLVEQTVTMAEKPPLIAQLRQAERGVGLETHTQGRDGSRSEELFDVSVAGKVDLLVVMDDSGSMGDEQDKLKMGLPSLTKFLASTDWQIVVVTTTSSCIRNNRIIKSTDADRDAAFAAAIDAKTSGQGNERGILMAHRNFEQRCVTYNSTGANDFTEAPGSKWWRDDSDIAVLFVSDEENFCNKGGLNPNCPNGSEPAQLNTLLTGAAGLRPKATSANKVKGYALTWDDDQDATCDDVNGETKGTRYLDTLKLLNGVDPEFASLCDKTKYDKELEKISKDVARGLKKDHELKFTPDSTTMTVTVSKDGTNFSTFTDWEVVGKKVNLKTLPADALKAKIIYRYGSTAKFERLKLATPAAAGTVEVFVNDQPVDPAKLTWDTAQNELFFMDMPADDAVVKVKFRKNEPLSTTFDLAAHTMPDGPHEVRIGTKRINDVNYDPVTKLLTFATPPGDGAEIKVLYRSSDSRILDYAASATDIANLKHDVTARDAGTGDDVPVTLKGQTLVFSEEDVFEGRKVIVGYDYGNATDALQHTLPADPLPGTLDVKVVSGDVGCIDGVTVAGRDVTFFCNGDQLEEVSIAYDYIAERFTQYTLPGSFSAKAHWQVFVDGAAVNFTRDGNTVTIPLDKLTDDSKVRIVVIEDYNA